MYKLFIEKHGKDSVAEAYNTVGLQYSQVILNNDYLFDEKSYGSLIHFVFEKTYIHTNTKKPYKSVFPSIKVGLAPKLCNYDVSFWGIESDNKQYYTYRDLYQLRTFALPLKFSIGLSSIKIETFSLQFGLFTEIGPDFTLSARQSREYKDDSQNKNKGFEDKKLKEEYYNYVFLGFGLYYDILFDNWDINLCYGVSGTRFKEVQATAIMFGGKTISIGIGYKLPQKVR